MSEGKRKFDSTENESTKQKRNESVPFDLKYMLQRFCCKEYDEIWMPFATSNDFSVRYARHLGYNVLVDGVLQDFFACQQAPPTATIVVAAAQFSKKREVLQKLVQLNLPFVVVLPSDTVQRDFFINLLKSSMQTHCWCVRLPTKTLFFHSDGNIQPLPRFKTAFFSCRPTRSDKALNNNDDVTQDVFSLLDIKVLDYATMRRTAGVLVCNRPFETTCEKNLGKTLPRKKRQAKLQQESQQQTITETLTESKEEPIAT